MPERGPDVARADFPSSLRMYQVRGALFLLNSESALLADEMGLGKTVQALVALRGLLSAEPGSRALVVVPKSLRLNWYEEARKWIPDVHVRTVTGNRENRRAIYALPVPVLIATYDQISVDWRLLVNLGDEYAVAILDEAQRIKNPSSRASWSCRLIPRRRSWALSGTPIENRVEDIQSIFRFVRPGLLSGNEERAELHSLIRPHFLRRTKAAVLPDLPEISTNDLHLSLSGSQARAYQTAWQSRGDIIPRSGTWTSDDYASAFALITRLKQLCNYDPSTGESVKLDALKLIVENVSAGGGKLLIFSQYVNTLKWIQRRVNAIRLDIFSGEQSEEARNQVLRAFRESADPCGLLVSIRAGGVGLNLKEASTVVLFDRWWNPAVEEQAVQRAHRFGRTDRLVLNRFLVVDTIEERIAQILADKRELFRQYVDEAGNAEVFGREELLRILK